jgi:hypothetical protein
MFLTYDVVMLAKILSKLQVLFLSLLKNFVKYDSLMFNQILREFKITSKSSELPPKGYLTNEDVIFEFKCY